MSNRRAFLETGAGILILRPETAFGSQANSTPELGLIGCGNRGVWITGHFLEQTGAKVTAIADAFEPPLAAFREKFGVSEKRSFAGLDGYREMVKQKVDAVVIESPPYFHPEHAAAAVDAGKHVYLAKPIAVDVPGCRSIEASAKKATANKLCFLVDFQTRAHPNYQEAVKRVQSGQIGKLISLDANYVTGPTWNHMDRALREKPNDPEMKLRAWGIDRVLSGDVITEQNIHALDVATWFLDAAPLRAYGTGGQKRGFLGTCWDHFAVTFEFPNDIPLSFHSKQVGHGIDDIQCRAYGLDGTADTHYFGEVWVRSRDDLFNGGKLGNLYQEGVVNNITTFYNSIIKSDFTNTTVAPSVRSNLTTILGRTAAYKRTVVTWNEMMQANETWRADLSGLRA